MEASVKPLAAIYALNTDLVANCLEGLGEAEVNQRLSGGGNSIAFLLAHLVDAKHFLLDALDASLPNPLADALSEASSIEEVGQMPPLAVIVDSWQAVSSRLVQVLGGLTPHDLDREIPQRFPIAGGTVLDAVTFLVQHDSYHLGQIAFLRRQLDFPAMSYDRSGDADAPRRQRR